MRICRHQSLLLGAVFALLCAAGSAARQDASALPANASPQQPPVTFRAEATFIEVHAIVTGPDGAFVRDLTADDFEIYEDGTRQKPVVCQLVDLPVERPPAVLSEGRLVEPDVRAATRTFDGRLYVLLLDDLHTTVTRTAAVKENAKRFIETYLGPGDLAAVVYTSGRQEAGQELTSSRTLLLAAVDRFVGRKLPSANRERLALHLRDAAVDDRDARGNPLPSRTTEGAQRARSVTDPLDAERGFYARRALQAIEDVSRWLAEVQGRRKALLLFSEGIDYDIYEPFNTSFASTLTQEAQEAIAAAQRANVTVYGIDPRGLNQTGTDLIDIHARSDYPQLDYGNFRGALRELLLSQESLIGLSEQTGGLAIINANDVAGGLARVVLDNSRYYLLGYYSDPARWRGRFIRLDVRVKRPGLQVRARRGYMPPPDREIERTRQPAVVAGTTPALRAALGKPVPIGDLPLRAFAAPFRGERTAGSVLIALEIDGPSLRFRQRNGRFAESLEVSIVAADERARVQGGDRQTFDLNLLPDTYERVRRTGVRMLSRLDLPPGRYQIRVGAHETTGGAVAMVPLDIEVPDYSKLPLSLSGLLLATSHDAGIAVTANLEAQPPGTLGSPPIVRRRFSTAETLAVYVEAYDNAGQTPHTLTYRLSVASADGRILFRTEDRRDLEGSNRPRTLGFRTLVPLRDLHAGTYVLRAEATTLGHITQREIPFGVSTK